MSERRYIYAHRSGYTPSDATTGPYFSTYERAEKAMRDGHPEWQPDHATFLDDYDEINCVHTGPRDSRRGLFANCDLSIARYELDEDDDQNAQ